jgi:signal transduction histidine kinase/ActR/RegA family two-component response regulator
MTDRYRVMENRLLRERKARKQAEQLLEVKSRELYNANLDLQNFADNLEKLVEERTAELEAMRDEAMTSNRIKGVFLANMSHEIRTPISAVIGMAELLLDSELSHEQLNQMQVILSASRSLLILINDILDLSRMEAGKLQLEESDFELCKLLDELIDTLSINAHDKHLEFGAAVHTPLPALLHGDPQRLRQILTNLLSNAINFTDRGSVRLDVTQVAREAQTITVHFAITDTGIGISERDSSLLFKKFSQLEQGGRTRKHLGSGLGLSICKTLVDHMNGQIGCDSSVGHGSTFWFALPFPTPATETSNSHPPGQRILFGLVADEALRQLITTQAAYLGISCSLCQDISALRQLIANYHPGAHSNLSVLIDANSLQPDNQERFEALKIELAALPCRLFHLGWKAHSSEGGQHDDANISRPLTHNKLLKLFQTTTTDGLSRPTTQSTTNTANAANPNQQARILLAEDSPSLQLVTQAMLNKLGYQVQLATNGREAINAVRQGEFDLVLMDIQMPEIDGIEATRLIRELHPPLPADIPIIALTAFAMVGDKEEFLRAGMNDYVTKPINKKALAEVLARWLPRTTDDNDG